ncbi:MAG: hypothetical protein JWP06_710 [Candidatus Saccharibacteria bacterium]|jgi:uncharacterized protein YdeI (YjbR/CyaY-like superfamily)|nr:hypothetical protein [Candidatus Saccharibacteria bacterium]
METFNDLPVISFKDSTAWEAWLSTNVTLHSGIWLKIAKKKSGVESISHPEALDVALCYGWIDGLRRSFDEVYFLQKFTPRRSRSLWSKINIEKVGMLIASGRMQASGLTEITAAKADGRWDVAYESQKNATIPPDLAAAFKKNTRAKEFFESLNNANQYAVLWRLMTAKTPETRLSRLQKLLDVLERGEKFH